VRCVFERLKTDLRQCQGSLALLRLQVVKDELLPHPLQLLPDFYRSSLKIHVVPSESSRFLGSTALTGSVDNVFLLAGLT
jgi:hypothetical protein